MVHLWQQEYGTPSRAGYHNQEWAKEMDRVGLVPSSTGAPGGARVGQRMTHYVEKGGAFERAFLALPKDAFLPFTCGEPPKASKPSARKDKIKYTCPACGANVWGKSGLAIRCDEDDELFGEDEG